MKELIASTRRLADELKPLTFGAPAACVYQPLEYAWKPHRRYVERFAAGPKRVVFLGMNPGPYGMVQTGVPFGEIAAVRDWMGIEEPVGKPVPEHPKRPVQGFACTRSEVSGRRLWGLFADRFGTADAFFKDHFVLNFCPLVWMGPTGVNLTPDKLSAADMAPVEAACLKHLGEVIALMKPAFLIGVGAFAEQRLQRAVEDHPSPPKIGRILHPSPASPAANRGWPEVPARQLTELGVW